MQVRSNNLVCRTSLSDDDVPSDTTYRNTVWIQKLTVMLATCAEVELEDSIAVKHLNSEHRSSNQSLTQLLSQNNSTSQQNNKPYQSYKQCPELRSFLGVLENSLYCKRSSCSQKLLETYCSQFIVLPLTAFSVLSTLNAYTASRHHADSYC